MLIERDTITISNRMLSPRGLRVDEAANYVGISVGHFKKLVREGVLPQSMSHFGGARRWDRSALDRALDNLSGNKGAAQGTDSPYDEWKCQ